MSNLPIEPRSAEAATSQPLLSHRQIPAATAGPHGCGRVRMLACLEAHSEMAIGLRQPEDHDVVQGARFELQFERARHLPGKARQGQEVCLDVCGDGKLQWNAASAAASIEARSTASIREGMPGHAAGRELGLPRATAWRWACQVAAESSRSSKRADRDCGDQTQAIDTIIGLAA